MEGAPSLPAVDSGMKRSQTATKKLPASQPPPPDSGLRGQGQVHICVSIRGSSSLVSLLGMTGDLLARHWACQTIYLGKYPDTTPRQMRQDGGKNLIISV